MKLVLASKSPRRKEILSRVVSDFEVRVSNAEEIYPSDTPPYEIPKILAEIKALAVPMRDDEIIIGSDTVVISHDGKIMGKPTDRDDAISMLTNLTSHPHEVVSGVCVRSSKKVYSAYEVTRVFMKNVPLDEICKYIDEEKPYDKAGAYGIQEGAGEFVEKIEGDFNNVVGLPLSLLLKILKDEFDIEL